MSASGTTTVRAGALVLLMVAAQACGAVTTERDRPGPAPALPAASVLVLRHFTLSPSGLGFALHPAATPIVLSASAGAALRACPADGFGGDEDPSRGKSFGRLWRGPCRRLTARPLALPATDGGQHVGVRVLPAGGGSVRVAALTLRWHCTDRFFHVRPFGTAVRAGRPAFDC